MNERRATLRNSDQASETWHLRITKGEMKCRMPQTGEPIDAPGIWTFESQKAARRFCKKHGIIIELPKTIHPAEAAQMGYVE